LFKCPPDLGFQPDESFLAENVQHPVRRSQTSCLDQTAFDSEGKQGSLDPGRELPSPEGVPHAVTNCELAPHGLKQLADFVPLPPFTGRTGNIGAADQRTRRADTSIRT
jgi:hypothetical protein